MIDLNLATATSTIYETKRYIQTISLRVNKLGSDKSFAAYFRVWKQPAKRDFGQFYKDSGNAVQLKG